MPKFNQAWFNGAPFGNFDLPPSNLKDSIHRISLGIRVRRTFRKYHTGGTWHYVTHTVGGVTRKSHYLTSETWNSEQALIFRVRPGNGHAGSIPGEIYQDKMKYFVPPSINNTQGQPARNAFKQAVLNWQTVLTEEQKIEYNKRATKGLRMSGYNLYISEYVSANA
jgi:hypothetical protein